MYFILAVPKHTLDTILCCLRVLKKRATDTTLRLELETSLKLDTRRDGMLVLNESSKSKIPLTIQIYNGPLCYPITLSRSAYITDPCYIS